MAGSGEKIKALPSSASQQPAALTKASSGHRPSTGLPYAPASGHSSTLGNQVKPCMPFGMMAYGRLGLKQCGAAGLGPSNDRGGPGGGHASLPQPPKAKLGGHHSGGRIQPLREAAVFSENWEFGGCRNIATAQLDGVGPGLKCPSGPGAPSAPLSLRMWRQAGAWSSWTMHS